MPTTPPAVDLRALLQDRKEKNGRPTIRETICLDPDALDRLNLLQDEKDARDARKSRDEEDPDRRMAGRPDPLAKDLAEAEADVKARSVVGVWRVPTRERQAELQAQGEDGVDIDPIVVSECFVHFVRNNDPIPADELGRADLDVWIALAARGEVNDIAFNIMRRSVGRPNFPTSVARSLATRR